MDLTFLTDLTSPLVLAWCLILGYILKHWIKDLDNKIIPTVLTVVGMICSCLISWDINMDVLVRGAFSGLASTGLHQVFKQFIENQNNKTEE